MSSFRLIGVTALVAGPFVLILAILRFLFVASAAPPEILFADPLLWVLLLGSALSMLYGAVTVFGGYNPALLLRMGRTKALAVASLLCGVCSVLLIPLGLMMLASGGGPQTPVRIVGFSVGVTFFPLVIAGLVLGHSAWSRIRKEPEQSGAWTALLALFFCYTAVALPFVLVVLRH
jgi:hypothetical protein